MTTLLSFVGGMFLSAAGFGWWSAAKYYGLKIEFHKEVAEVRHRFAGTLEQMRVWSEEEHDVLAARIKELELYRARRNGDQNGRPR